MTRRLNDMARRQTDAHNKVAAMSADETALQQQLNALHALDMESAGAFQETEDDEGGLDPLTDSQQQQQATAIEQVSLRER